MTHIQWKFWAGFAALRCSHTGILLISDTRAVPSICKTSRFLSWYFVRERSLISEKEIDIFHKPNHAKK